MSNRRQWKGWFVVYLLDHDEPYGFSPQYEVEIPPGPDELEHMVLELYRRWFADGSQVMTRSELPLANRTTVLC